MIPHWLSSRLNSTLVGIVASIIDWLLLILFVKVFHLTPQMANFPSLFIGSAIQFFGNRTLVFKATEGNIGKQASEFALVEAAAFVLNGGLFYVLVTWTSLNYALARPLSSFAVFICFSYPLWRLVFRKSKSGTKN